MALRIQPNLPHVEDEQGGLCLRGTSSPKNKCDYYPVMVCILCWIKLSLWGLIVMASQTWNQVALHMRRQEMTTVLWSIFCKYQLGLSLWPFAWLEGVQRVKVSSQSLHFHDYYLWLQIRGKSFRITCNLNQAQG